MGRLRILCGFLLWDLSPTALSSMLIGFLIGAVAFALLSLDALERSLYYAGPVNPVQSLHGIVAGVGVSAPPLSALLSRVRELAAVAFSSAFDGRLSFFWIVFVLSYTIVALPVLGRLLEGGAPLVMRSGCSIYCYVGFALTVSLALAIPFVLFAGVDLVLVYRRLLGEPVYRGVVTAFLDSLLFMAFYSLLYTLSMLRFKRLEAGLAIGFATALLVGGLSPTLGMEILGAGILVVVVAAAVSAWRRWVRP